MLMRILRVSQPSWSVDFYDISNSWDFPDHSHNSHLTPGITCWHGASRNASQVHPLVRLFNFSLLDPRLNPHSTKHEIPLPVFLSDDIVNRISNCTIISPNNNLKQFRYGDGWLYIAKYRMIRF